MLKCITTFWNKYCTCVILIKFWLCFFFCPDCVLLSSCICGQFYLQWWMIIVRNIQWNCTKVGVQKLVGQAFPLTTVTAVFLFYQLSKNVCNNQIGLKIHWFHLEINCETGIKHPARKNIGLWCCIMDKYINLTMGFFLSLK